MTQLLSSRGVDISQRNFQQIIIRGDGKDQFNQIINQEISILPPSKNLEVTTNHKFILAKNSFDQWSLIYLVEQDYKEILKFISKINSNDEILASDYSYGQVYFEISGENKNEFLKNLDADIALTCAYGQLIPKEFLELTKKGFINIHASLLPPVSYTHLTLPTKA